LGRRLAQDHQANALDVALLVNGVQGGLATSGTELPGAAYDGNPAMSALKTDVSSNLHPALAAQAQGGLTLTADRWDECAGA
jgi:hypothetical protein